MPDEFTPEEKKLLAESPADSATLIGDEADSADTPTADEEPPAGSHA